MSTITGILQKANERNGYWSICVDDKWYSTYKTNHSDKEGRAIEVEYEEVERNGRTFRNAKKVKVVNTPAPAAAAGGAPMSADARQQSIVMQSSFRTAAEILGTMVAADALTLGSKKADKFDILMDAHQEIALRLYKGAMDPASVVGDDAEDDDALPPEDGWDPTEA